MDKFRIAIIGAGPAGLSAAARAAEQGVPHVLLEAAPHIANTVHRYQKGKLVMSEPAQLPLGSSLSFSCGIREDILNIWHREIEELQVNVRTDAKVSDICGQRGDFRITLASGDVLTAECVILAIGLQGNIRKLGVPGDDLPGVQYQLDDPEEYMDETIVVVGGGDSGVENALALAKGNRVTLLNRKEEFTQCREANFKRLREAMSAGQVETHVSTSVLCVEAGSQKAYPLSLVVQSPQGVGRIECHRVIARLGAIPPRKTLEGFGVRFPSEDAMSVPELSEQFESNVPGMYIIGALAGYPLIKQAMNQGYEVVEHILGNPVEPADHNLLLRKFSRIPGLSSVKGGIELLRCCQPLLESLTPLQLREFMLDSEILVPQAGEVIFRKNDYGNSFFSVLQGSVHVHVEKRGGEAAVFTLSCGDFFGEIGLLSGRRRSGTVIAGEGCVLVETPRRSMLNLLYKVPGVQRKLDEVWLKRIVSNCFNMALTQTQLDHLVQDARHRSFVVGEVVFNEGDEPDALYMIRRGSVTVSRRVNGKEVVLAYVSAGNYVGEMALVSNMPRTATVRAASPTEMVLLEAGRFNAVVDENVTVRSEVTARYLEVVRSNESTSPAMSSELLEFLVDQGVGGATSVLLIDYGKCIRCNNCETACADVHGGTSRLNRKGGRTHGMIHVPASCRHCEHPRCMKDCPPDAIHRSPNGEVFIGDSCIGCGNCLSNCTYGVIQMAEEVVYQRPGLMELIFGIKPRARSSSPLPDKPKTAVKCDMCMGIIGGSACIRACPTGAVFRVSPEQFLAISSKPNPA